MVTSEKVQSYHWKKKEKCKYSAALLAIHHSLVQTAVILFHHLLLKQGLHRGGAGQTCQCQPLAAGRSSPRCNRSAGSGGRGSNPWWEGGRPGWSGISSPLQLYNRSLALWGEQTASELPRCVMGAHRGGTCGHPWKNRVQSGMEEVHEEEN